jgi:leucyl/phenylalanyl-tRNA---protein transferase
VFFGESMFTRAPDASKAALVHLVERLRAGSCRVIDCQQATAHLASLGAREIPRKEFSKLLQESIQYPPWAPAWESPG